MCDVLGEFRAALCMSGGNRRTPPTLPPPDLADGGGEGEVDLLSALPDDILLFILSFLPSTTAAARTSVLSRRWRRLWAQLPMLWFPLPTEPACVIPSPSDAARTRVRSRRWRRLRTHLPALRFQLTAEPARAPRFQLPAEPARALHSPACALAALAQHSAPALLTLGIIANDADPGDMTAVLRLAAPRLTGLLFLGNVAPKDRRDEDEAVPGVRVPVELPCFDRAQWLTLYLGYRPLMLPPSGMFTKLTVLYLGYVRFHCDIGDAFSSARCPSLQQLRIFDAQGLSDLVICSESLLSVHLYNLKGLRQLTVVSPILKELHIFHCFFKRQSVADITAPVLEKLKWVDSYDPRSVHLGEMAQLRLLETSFYAYACYGLPEHQYNWGIAMLLRSFRRIPALFITILYPIKTFYCQYWMDALTLLTVENLNLLFVMTCGHAFGSCVFHFLKISTGIRRLFLDIREGIKEGTACSPDCVCDQLHEWESEELFLNSLQELTIFGLTDADYDFTFVKRLLGWASLLKTITITFDLKAVVNKELCEELLDLSGPETCMKIYLYRNGAKVMYRPAG